MGGIPQLFMTTRSATPTSFAAQEMPSDPSQKAVSRQCVGALLRAWRLKGGSTSQLLTRQGLEVNLGLDSPRFKEGSVEGWVGGTAGGFIAWPTFAALLHALGEKLDAEAFREAGREAWAKHGILAAGFWMRNLYTVTEAYEQVFGLAYAHVSPLQQILPCLEMQCRTAEEGAVWVSLRLKPGHAMAREFFWYLQGVVEGLPRMHGLRPFAAICEWHGQGMDLRLTAPTTLPLLARLRRAMVMALAPKFLSRELQKAHLALQAKAADLETQLRLLNQAKADEQAARLRADMASEAKNDFLKAMSHDLRTPLNGIVGLAELLAEALSEGEQKQDARTIVSSSQELRLQIDHLLNYAQWAHENSAPDWAEVDIEKILRELAQSHAPACYAKGLNFNLKIDATLPPLRTDARRLSGALSIFLDNACKHAQRGTVTLAATFDAHALTLEIRDEGPGISPQSIQTLFQAAPAAETSAPSAQTSARKNHGFNLAIAAQLAESLKAMVGVTSRQGHGTVFSLRLPWIQASTQAQTSTPFHASSHLQPDWVPAPGLRQPSAATASPEPQAAESESSEPGLRILVVEDHALSRHVTERLLRRAGHQVFSASRGLEAAKLCREHAYDVVLLDIHLPGMDGIAAGRTILKGSENPPRIVAFTASVSEADKRACQEAGFDAFIAKPAPLQTLLATLESLVQVPRGLNLP